MDSLPLQEVAISSSKRHEWITDLVDFQTTIYLISVLPCSFLGGPGIAVCKHVQKAICDRPVLSDISLFMDTQREVVTDKNDEEKITQKCFSYRFRH